MAPSTQIRKSAFLQEKSACFSSTSSCSTFWPSSTPSCSLSVPSADPRAPLATSSSSPQQPSSARFSSSSPHYAAAYPTPVEAYTPSSNPSKTFSMLTPASLSLSSGTHRPKSLPPGRTLRVSEGGGMKLHHQSVRHVSGNGSSGASSSAPDTAATSLSCPSPPSSTGPRQYLIGEMVVSSSLRSLPPPVVPSSAGSTTPAAASTSSPAAAHSPVAATTPTSLHPPVAILHSKPYGLFGPLPKSLLREGHKQRIAGVDVLKLPDSTIIPRIENSSLQQMLQTDPSMFTALEAALRECVIFLYDEGIKPFAGEIAHQMRKRIEGGSWLPSEVVALAVAAKDVYPRVERRVKGEDGWVVLLKKELHPPQFDGFVDTRAREDCYSPEQWREFNRYFIEKMRVHPSDSGGSTPTAASASQFTEGRYALAERLRAEIPMFQSMKLAHLIRMVQLASWKKLLTYRDKALVPVAACPVTAKEFAQRNCMNLRGSDKSAAALASIEQLLRALSCIVDPEPTGIFLAQLKDLVRWTTYERLDCMVLGHTKLQDLLMSEPFIRFYRLYTPEGNEHCTYVQSKKFPLPWGAVLHTKCSMLWDPDACPMDPPNEQQHFSLSDAGCCWQYKALIPLYAQQRSSVGVADYAYSCESQCVEAKNSKANGKKTSASLFNCNRKARRSFCGEGNASNRFTSTLDENAAMSRHLPVRCENACGSKDTVTTSVNHKYESEEGDAEDAIHAVFHWVERDILRLLDDDGIRRSPSSEPETMFYSVANEEGLTRELPADEFQSSISPGSGRGLQRLRGSSPVTHQPEVLMESVHVLVHASPQGSSSVPAEVSAAAWHANDFLDARSEGKEHILNSTEDGLSAVCTPSAPAALSHLALASQASPCCCSPVRREEALPFRLAAHKKHKNYSTRPAASGNRGREDKIFSSPCPTTVAAPTSSASMAVPCWQDSKFRISHVFKPSPSLDAAAYVGHGCYLSVSCISSSPYKREEENMRTPSTSSDGVLQVSPPLMRGCAGTGLTSSSEIGTNDLQARTLSHAEKSRETK